MALVAAWAMELDGSEVTDYSGNDLHGTNNGAVTDAAGKYDNCLDFERSESDYVSIPNLNTELDGGSACTFMCWLKPESFASWDRFLASSTGSDSDDHDWMFGLTTAQYLRVRLN